MSVASGIKFWDSMHQLFSCAPLLSHCSQYLPNTHKFMKNLIDLSRYQHRCWSTNTGKNGLWWWRSQWFSIWLQSGIQDPPLLLDSVWDCLGITLDTIKDDDGKTILGWRCGYCLILAIVVVLDSSNTVMHLRFVAPYKGEGHCHLYRLAAHSCKCCPCLNHIDEFKGKQKTWHCSSKELLAWRSRTTGSCPWCKNW